MSYKNFETLPIALTTLAPIHIGCGEDYEAINFVVDFPERQLYSFDPSVVKLTEEKRKELLSIVERNSFRGICAFYERNVERYKAFSKVVVPFDSRVEKKIKNLLGKTDPKKTEEVTNSKPNNESIQADELKAISKNSIKRFCYCDNGDLQVPYIPGSCIKGAVHTALLDRLSVKKDPRPFQTEESERPDVDEKILGGTMNKSPMKFLSISDLLAPDPYMISQKIIIGVRVKKEKELPRNPKGIINIYEILQKAQFRCFTGTLTLRKDNVLEDVKSEFQNHQEVFKVLNDYSRKEFKEEYKYWEEKDLSGALWVKKIKKLLEDPKVKRLMDEGNIALIRIGKNCGARNLTIRKEGFPRIEIYNPNKPEERNHATDSTTRVIAIDNEQSHPFGWALLEFTEISNGKPIEEWVRRVNEGIRSLDLKALREEFLKEKDLLIKEYEKDQFRIEENRRAEQAKALEEQKHREEMDRLTEERRSVVELKEKIQATSQVAPGTALYKEFVELLTKATAWQAADKVFLAEAFAPLVKKKGLDAGKKGKEIKNTLKTYKEAK